ncbi:hypothetical protein HMPREF0863_04216 [Erysipelotrichaceae bacterium 5_2_54FAA]|nr:hypothetical protein HMPREF0863_04216 [Erysipelotrichaceae bacterium 5_2_54FAA]
MAHIECGVVMGGNDSGFGIFIFLLIWIEYLRTSR